jgi:hypothetical protein
MKAIKQSLSLILILTLVITITLSNNQVLAEEITSTTTSLFTDVGANSWFNKFVVRMHLREAVTGYGDGTFKPNQGVNQLEAVTMMMRFLGYKEVAEEFYNLEIDKESTLYEYVKDVPSWGKGSVALAYQLELINKNTEAGFEPFKEASRVWIAKLIIDGVKKRGSLEELTELKTFTDDSSIPTWAYYAVNEAVMAEITTGNADGSFKPNDTVTRAELTAFMYRSERYIDSEHLENVVRGKIVQQQDDSLILDLGTEQTKRVYFGTNPTIYYDYDSIAKVDLKVGDKISAMVNNSEELIFIDVLDGPSRTEEIVEGTIILIDHNRKVLTIENSNGELLRYNLIDTTQVVNEDMVYEINELSINDKVALTILADQILKIELIDSYKSKTTGEIVSINHDKNIVTVQFNNEQLSVFTIDNDIIIHDLHGKVESTQSMSVGDKITLSFEGDVLKSIQLRRFEITKAEIKKITTSSKTIEVAYDGNLTTYMYSNNLKVKIDGYYEPVASDLSVGDSVRVTVHDNVILEVEVLNRRKAYYFYNSADISAKAIKVLSLKDKRYYYLNYNDTTKFYKDGKLITSVMSLTANDRIEVTFTNNEVLRVETAVVGEGTITEIDLTNSLIKVKDIDNKVKTLVLTDDVLITINNQLVTPANLSIGDKLIFFVVNERLYEIYKN